MPMIDPSQEEVVSLTTRTSSALEGGEAVAILCEICCGFNLNLPDVEEDLFPFCVIQFDSKVLHRTRSVFGRHPIWTPSSRSLFVLKASLDQLARHDLCLAIWLKRKDPLMLTVLETAFLGDVKVSGLSLLEHCNEERFQLELSCDARTLGALVVRFRLATPADESLVMLVNDQVYTGQVVSNRSIYQLLQSPPLLVDTRTSSRPLAPLVTEIDETQLAGASFVQAISTAFTRKRCFEDGQTRVLVKPNPDPDNEEATAYMTKEELADETMKPSKEYIHAGSGKLGKVYLEILKCHDLPNVDVGEAVGNVTDPFVTVVFEDCMVQTCVIDDELSPHWLPWTQRAYCFSLIHPSSVLYLGVFDFDFGTKEHAPIGRVAVNLSNLRPRMEYTLRYDLYKSANVTDRSPTGSITIRLRIEYNNDREALLMAFQPRPRFHVNVRREKTLACCRYACFGEHGDDSEQEFDFRVTRSYINEIWEQKSILSYCLCDAMWSLLFWKGQIEFGGVSLPIHSYLLFCMSTIVVERPYLTPSFFLLSVAWVMLALQTFRSQHPSPWMRCHSFWHFVSVLILGSWSVPSFEIEPGQGSERADLYEKEWATRLENDQKLAAMKRMLEEEMALIGDESIHTKFESIAIPIDLLERLTRYQSILARLCRRLRFAKSVLTWEESFISFVITAGFLGVGLVSFLLPWSFILLWSGRIFAWGLLGPHMKIVGLFLEAHKNDEDKGIPYLIESFKRKTNDARLRNQEALKLKDIKSLSFGGFSTLIPTFNLSRHYDRPLSSSFSRVCEGDVAFSFAKHHVPGQQCYGAIIPRTESGFERFETEQPRLKAILKTLTKSLKKIDQSQDQRSRESLHQAHSSNVDGLRQLAASGSDLIEDSDEVLQPESKVVQVRPLSSSCMFHTAVPKKAVSVVQNSMQRHENVCEVDDFRDDLEATECFGVEVVLEERECDREETDHGDKICLYHRVCATS